MLIKNRFTLLMKIIYRFKTYITEFYTYLEFIKYYKQFQLRFMSCIIGLSFSKQNEEENSQKDLLIAIMFEGRNNLFI